MVFLITQQLHYTGLEATPSTYQGTAESYDGADEGGAYKHDQEASQGLQQHIAGVVVRFRLLQNSPTRNKNKYSDTVHIITDHTH